MANRRQKKKQQKRILQQQVKSQAKLLNLSEKQIEKVTFSTLKTLSEKAEKVQHKERKRKKADSRRSTRLKKQKYLESLGIDVWTLRLKDIDSVKIKDIESKQVNSKNYPHLFKNAFDFNKVYTLKNNERMYFAFRDFAGETSLEEILSLFYNLSDVQLLERLKSIVGLKPTYRKKGSKTKHLSSGKAGDYKYICANQTVIELFHKDNYNYNRRKKINIRKHQGQYKGFQVLKSGARNSLDKFTPHNMLILLNAFMYNITELDRDTFYKNVYRDLCKHAPDFAEILPKP